MLDTGYTHSCCLDALYFYYYFVFVSFPADDRLMSISWRSSEFYKEPVVIVDDDEVVVVQQLMMEDGMFSTFFIKIGN